MFKSHHSKVLLVFVIIGLIGVGYYWKQTCDKVRIIEISRAELEAAMSC